MRKQIAVLCGVIAGAWALGPLAAQGTTPGPIALPFSKTPMLVDGRVPAPNVFLALDSGNHAPETAAAWQAAFGVQSVPDGTVRLAWQATGQCEALPDPGPLCKGRNGLAPIGKARRNELAAFLEDAGKVKPQESQRASAQRLVEAAQAHLTGFEAESSQAGAAPLTCRQSHLLLATPDLDPARSELAPAEGGRPDISARTVETGASGSVLRVKDSVDAMLAESQSLPTHTAASLAASSPAPSTAGQTLFATLYNARRWSGDIVAQGSNGDSPAPWGMREDQAKPHSSASLLDQRDPDTRLILSSTGAGAQLRPIAFRWQQLAPWQQAALGEGDALGPQRLAYLRGDRSGEQVQGGPFRNRDSRQADSVNSALWYAAGTSATAQAPARPDMLYVGANGGMLHAFSARTGTEVFAYVPQGMFGRLPLLTRPQYRHEYFVDGSPWTAAIDDAGRPRALLVGFLGAGGRGYFVLDVSDAASWSEENAATAGMVMLDTTADKDPDIGHIVGGPVREQADSSGTRQIARLNNGRWALVIGNGYGSDNQRAMLLIQFLDGARELVKLPVGAPGGNGLSMARLLDTDGDQTPDLAYAGDLLGQLWKFDLSSGNPNEWHAAFKGRPLFTTRNPDGKPQPITAAPLLVRHPEGGRVVVFGTGRFLSDPDRADAATQSVYGIRDRDNAEPVPPERSALLQQSIDPVAVGTLAGRQLWTSTGQALHAPGEMEAKRGWYLDLPMAGERVIRNPVEYEGRLVDIVSMAPPAAFRLPAPPESCGPPAILHFRTTLNALDGARPRSELYGEAGGTLNASRIELPNEPGVQVKHGDQVRTLGLDGKEDVQRHRLGMVARRAAWRQLQ